MLVFSNAWKNLAATSHPEHLTLALSTICTFPPAAHSANPQHRSDIAFLGNQRGWGIVLPHINALCLRKSWDSWPPARPLEVRFACLGRRNLLQPTEESKVSCQKILNTSARQSKWPETEAHSLGAAVFFLDTTWS